ncbi:MAG: 2-oxo acid dehydrogenase subunit E2 [Acidimicrobiia bacterium]|nr:2-oxo acid dehydrogenase subunit E2 [Acidimicrobiia bacterium]
MADIEMPQLGETVTEGTITRWFKQVGDAIAQDEVLFEVSTDKVDTEVPSPLSGTITEIRVPEGETVEVGTVLAVLGDGAAAPASAAPATPAAAPPPPAAPAAPAAEAPAAAVAPPAPAPQANAAPAAEAPAPANAVPAPAPAPAEPVHEAQAPAPAPPAPDSTVTQGKVLSPVVRRLIGEYGIDPDQIQGTGLGGRISRDDVQRYIEANQLQPVEEGAAAPPPAAPTPAPAAPSAPAPVNAAPAPAPVAAPTPAPAAAAMAPLVQAGARDAVVPLSNIRLRTGEHMVMSKSVAPHTLTAIEVDYENVENVRRASGPEFKELEGFSLTYLPFICRATIDALREYPHLNASVGDRELVVHNFVNMAIAVDLDFQGLLAPVVRDADGKRMRSIARDIVDIARRARSKQLSPDELSGGTFTLTNAGSYGTMMQFPIINQPQVAILSTDGVKRKPVVIEDDYGNESIAIHSVGVLAMAWDHRAIDGAYAAAFLARAKEILETRDWDAELA